MAHIGTTLLAPVAVSRPAYKIRLHLRLVAVPFCEFRIIWVDKSLDACGIDDSLLKLCDGEMVEQVNAANDVLFIYNILRD